MPKREDVEYVILGFKDGAEIEYRDIMVHEDSSEVVVENVQGRIIGVKKVRWFTIVAHLATGQKDGI